jgi:broad specificity phosphatase PhoE
MVVWLVRHGQSTATPGLALGWSDPPLSPAGIAEANAAAERLSSRRLSAVYASDLLRARATADAVARPHRLPVHATPDLRELDFGDWEGRSLSDLWQEDPNQARAWEADIRATPAGFGESVADLERRVHRFAATLTAGTPATVVDAEVAVVAHMGSLAALRARLQGIDFAAAWRERVDPGASVRVEVPC